MLTLISIADFVDSLQLSHKLKRFQIHHHVLSMNIKRPQNRLTYMMMSLNYFKCFNNYVSRMKLYINFIMHSVDIKNVDNDRAERNAR